MSTKHHHHPHRHQANESVNPGNGQTKVLDDGSVRLKAYEIHCEKGGQALDNWLEAEQALKT